MTPYRAHVPGHLLDLAHAADSTPARVRPDMARRIARLIQQHLPEDDWTTLNRRRTALSDATNRWTVRDRG